jgi:hypothetical protein
LSELEQTSSAKSPVWWAGVERTGRISWSSTATPLLAHCHAASDPANPAPMIWIRWSTACSPQGVTSFAPSAEQRANHQWLDLEFLPISIASC